MRHAIIDDKDEGRDEDDHCTTKYPTACESTGEESKAERTCMHASAEQASTDEPRHPQSTQGSRVPKRVCSMSQQAPS